MSILLSSKKLISYLAKSMSPSGSLPGFTILHPRMSLLYTSHNN